jgi:hypothetical protein
VVTEFSFTTPAAAAIAHRIHPAAAATYAAAAAASSYQPLLFGQQQGLPSTAASSSMPSYQQPAGFNAEICEQGDGLGDDFDFDELCVVCWVGQRSVALVHGNDAHLVRKGGAAAAGVTACMCIVAL